MFSTKASVKRHVEELFRKVKDENERKIRCYSVAKLFYQVGDYESAKQYVSNYLEVKSESSAGRKLLGQIYESLGQKESALEQYKQSLELDGRQNDLVLKICELLVDVDTGLDLSRIKYWIDRANEKFPSHPVIFLLKEKMLMADKTNGSSDDLETLILSELSLRSSDVNLRVKLIKHYMEKNRLMAAYEHAVEIESFSIHRNEIKWYEVLIDLFVKCKERNLIRWPFWLIYLTALERLAALSLVEYGTFTVKTIPEAIQAVFNFDQGLTEAKSHISSHNPGLADQVLNHMTGQLHYHMACLLLRKTKREQKSWIEVGRMCSPLFLAAIHTPAMDSVSKAEFLANSIHSSWLKEAAFRSSQSNYVLQEYSKGNPKKLMDKIDEFLNSSWREQIFKKIFIVKHQEKMISSSYFVKLVTNPPLRLLSPTELKQVDELAKEAYPASLHHHVWLGLAKKHRSKVQLNAPEPYPNESATVFSDLQLSVVNLNQAAPDTLSVLDLDAFLNAAVICSSAIVDEQQRSGFLSPDRMPTLPADLTTSLCSTVQENWWSFAHQIYKEKNPTDLGNIRQELQRGLEVVRCIGNHGLHPVILVQLARIFQYRLNESDGDSKFLEARCELYWATAIPLLERLVNNNPIRSISTKMFDYQGKEMNNLELTNALDEGRLFLAKKYIKNKEYENAIDILQQIKGPEASFLLGDVYKKLADELMEGFTNETISTDLKSQYNIMLTKAKNSYYLTLDRLRNPGVDPNHPLNLKLGLKIVEIENELKINEDETRKNILNLTEHDVLDVSYLSTNDGTELIENNFNKSTNPSLISMKLNSRPKDVSTPRNHNLSSRYQTEARPSPERLDAQMRQLMYTHQNALQSIQDQQKLIVDSNKKLQETMDDIKKALNDLKLDFKSKAPSPSIKKSQKNEENQSFNYDLDYSDLNYSNPGPSTAGVQPMFPPRYPVYPTPIPPYFQSVPFNDPSRLQSLYLPEVYPPMYPPRGDQNMLPKVPDLSQTFFQQNLFNQRMINNQINEFLAHQQQNESQFLPTRPMPSVDLSGSDVMSREAHPQFSASFQHPGNLPLNSTPLQAAPGPLQSAVKPPSGPSSIFQPPPVIKDAPVNKAPPVNVVITTSDTLPTSVPPVQPTLSVTIPPHHINTGSNANLPHNYQISMPTQATIPTTVNLPPLNNSVIDIIAPIANNNAKSGINTSVLSTGSHNGSIETVEVEHDPIPDFAPIIPLPDEVKVVTGEENEETLYCARARLFRFADKEWKERGIGNVKLLKNDQGKVRLLMRRDQVHKICANHLLTPEMKLSAMNEKAWIWVANDFADEEVKLEKLCIRFKNAEEAQAFKDQFDKAKVLNESKEKASSKCEKQKVEKKAEPSLAEMFKPAAGSWECTSCYVRNKEGVTKCSACSSPAPGSQTSSQTTSQTFGTKASQSSKTTGQTPLSQLFKPEEGSWECKTCYVRNSKASNTCITCETPKDPSQLPKATSTTGFAPQTISPPKPTFSFGINPSQPAVSTPVVPSVFKSSGDATVTSTPFGVPQSKDSSFGFSFNSPKPSGEVNLFKPGKTEAQDFVFSPSNLGSIPTTNDFSFGKPGKSFNFQFESKSPVKSPAAADVSEDEVPESEDIYFAPVIPLPDKVEVKTGEEDEDVLYSHRAKLFRFDTKTKEWKERGLGDIKLLQHKETKKLRLVMRREQTLKLCLNHFVTDQLEITSKDEKTWIWNAADYSEGEIEYIQFACRFKDKNIAFEFKKAVDSVVGSLSTECTKNEEKSEIKVVEEKSPELQVVYEVQVTPEEKDAALKLQLPENFYAYKQKEDCAGCLGCKEPETPLFSNVEKIEEPKSESTVSVTLSPPKFSLLKNQSSQPSTVSTTISSSTVTSTSADSSKSPFVMAASQFKFSSSPAFKTPVANKTDKTDEASQKQSEATKNLFAGLNMCSPSTNSTIDFSKAVSATKSSVFGDPKPNLFGSNTTMFDGTPSIFGSKPSTTSIFGGNPAPVNSTSSSVFSTNTAPVTSTSSIFGDKPSPVSIFGGKATSTVTSATSTVTTSAATGFSFSFAKSAEEPSAYVFGQKPGAVFGGSAVPVFEKLNNQAPTGNKIFGETSIFSGKSFEGATPTFGASAVSKTETQTKAEESAFLKTDNTLDFSTLAAQGGESVGFRTAENFTFAGKGAPVFGKKPPMIDTSKNNTVNSVTSSKKTDDKEEEEGDDNADYDPHYEPIIPLPDAVEVRTGEEDEDKMFCQRAKLYRFEAETKEWKERGTGEMKLLYHPVNMTYRLLLRREQVFKVVCNFLLTPEIDLQPLVSSDKSWIWAGMNFVEDKMEMEKLAVRFKNADIAKEFKAAVEKAKEELAGKQQLKLSQNQSKSEEKDTTDEDQDEYQVEEADDEVDDEDDQHTVIFEKHAVLYYVDEPGEGFQSFGDGQLRIVYDSDFYGARINFILPTGEIMSSCLISMESTIEIIGKECTWTTLDDFTYENPVRKSFKAEFDSEEDAQNMLSSFNEGLDYAKHAEITENTYYTQYVTDEHDDQDDQDEQ